MLSTNATMIFLDYEVQDNGIRIHFVCPDPGPNEVSDYYITVTDAELSLITTLAKFKTLVLTKLQRKLRASDIASKLDPYIGQSLVV